MPDSLDSFHSCHKLACGGKSYTYFSLAEAAKNGLHDVSNLPFSIKILIENLLRYEDNRSVTRDDLLALGGWAEHKGKQSRDISFRPTRILMQDFTGVPAVVDLAAMRDAMVALGGDPQKINPLIPVDLVIDHSVIVDAFGSPRALGVNVEKEYERNGERYRFLRWGQSAFHNFRVVPPGTGICHQVNLEYLAKTVWTTTLPDGSLFAYPDTLLGTDSHTTMVNGLAVLGWGVGGIEAEAAMLGQPVSMRIPEVVGFKLTGQLAEGTTATDLVLTVTEMLRKFGVVGKFVEFFGAGLDHITVEDRSTISNMAPEYGATCGFFPIDDQTLDYLKRSARPQDHIDFVKAYAQAQGLFRTHATPDPLFTDVLSLDLCTVQPSLAGPKRPQDRVLLSDIKANFFSALDKDFHETKEQVAARYPVPDASFSIGDGDVVIAAITSCTNTSNPSVMIAAGLLARKAFAAGLKVKPWVKTSLAPGSQVVGAYLERSGLQKDLDALGFNLVGFGCTTCIGNSGPLPEGISKSVQQHNLVVTAVLSGNRNFEGRINPDTQANYLASPPLVVAYALAGTVLLDLNHDPIGVGADGKSVYLRDIWPSAEEVSAFSTEYLTASLFSGSYENVFQGDERWQALAIPKGATYAWDSDSTYVRQPPYFVGMTRTPPPLKDIVDARILGLFLDSTTTDHISPAGSIKKDSPAGRYLLEHGVKVEDFNQYGTRRGNHEVMMRGTFANIRMKNQMVKDDQGRVVEGGWTVHYPSCERMSMYDAAMRYGEEKVPLVVFAGKEYGTGSSRDWASKGSALLGIRAIIAQSFERIHRSNLVGMGIIPFMFEEGTSWQGLGITGKEQVTFHGISQGLAPGKKMVAQLTMVDGSQKQVPLICRIDTQDEMEYMHQGGILQAVLRTLLSH
jgi:aconitate hydratase